MTKLKILFLLKLFLISFILISCTETVGLTQTDKKETSFSIYPKNVEIIGLNQTLDLKAQAIDEDGNVINNLDNLSWTSSDELVATVNASGQVLSKAIGTVVISASYKTFDFSTSIKVSQTGNAITGTAQYRDKLYNTTGFSGSALRYIRYAEVELLADNGEVLQRTATDGNGYYAFNNIVPDKFSLRLIAEITGSPAPGFRVRDMQKNIYSFTQPSIDGTFNYPFTMTSSTLSGVFNMLDVMVNAANYSRDVLLTNVQDLDLYWRIGNTSGTYYCSGLDSFICFNGRGVYVLNQQASSENSGRIDTDEFDDDVILHEFGHYLTEKYSKDDSIGGRHRIEQNDSDLRLSWGEGWSTFFPSAVKVWLQSTNPTLLSTQSAITINIDTSDDSAASHNIASGELPTTPSDIDVGFYYAGSEAAVSRILWNIHQIYGMAKIWDVLANYFPNNAKPTSLPLFWDGLLASQYYNASQLITLTDVFAEREVNYSLDDSEDDNLISTANTQAVDFDPSTSNTIYSDTSVADRDYIAFSAIAGKSYKIVTKDLHNGLDTIIRLYDASGNLLQTNDDAIANAYMKFDERLNDDRIIIGKTAMSSQIDFNADTTGQYFVEIAFAGKSNATFGFVGHYGSYKLMISEVN